jgi:hypothetical protein
MPEPRTEGWTFYIRSPEGTLRRYYDPRPSQVEALLAATLFANRLEPIEDTPEVKAEWLSQGGH